MDEENQKEENSFNSNTVQEDMSKKSSSGMVVGLIIILVIILGLGAWFMFSPSEIDEVENIPETETTDPSGEFMVEGVIVMKDTSAMVHDGPAVFDLVDEIGREVTIEIPSGETQCVADFDDYFQAEVGDSVEVFGHFRGSNVEVCHDPEYYFRIIQSSEEEEEDQEVKEDSFEEQLAFLNKEIEEVLNKEAGDVSECKSIAFGSKPCGGPWTFLVYSETSTDVSKLEELVSKYNAVEKDRNQALELVSDCGIPNPPVISLEDGVCTP